MRHNRFCPCLFCRMLADDVQAFEEAHRLIRNKRICATGAVNNSLPELDMRLPLREGNCARLRNIDQFYSRFDRCSRGKIKRWQDKPAYCYDGPPIKCCRRISYPRCLTKD